MTTRAKRSAKSSRIEALVAQAVMGRPQPVATDPKQIPHGTVPRQEALRVAG